MTQPDGRAVSYTYDVRGNRTSLTYPDGRTVKYTYDELDRLTAVDGLDGETTKYSYDELGRRIKTDGAEADTVYAYDEVGNLVSQITTGAYDLALEYAYDRSGRMLSESRMENGATVTSSYIYDALGQLTGFIRSDGYSESYTYDPVGNMSAKTADGVRTDYSYNAANQLVNDGTNEYTYDANGNLIKKTNAGGSVSYTYNAINLLESWTNGEYSEEYTYNPAGLLSTITTAESTTTLTWDLLHGAGVVISAVQDGKTTDYTYGRERISAITGSDRTEYVYDGRGSVAGEISYNTAWYALGGLISGRSITTKAYTPFGEQMGEAASGFGFNGEYYNARTGQLYLRARFYEPLMNRFSQKDKQYFVINEYMYCYNNPICFVDVDGREAIVVSGGDYNDAGETDEEGLNSYTFISSALREIESIERNNLDDHVTWIIADIGWSSADKEMFQHAVDGKSVEIIYMTQVGQLTSYINTQSTNAEDSSIVSREREQDQITYMSVFSHGAEGSILFGHNGVNDDTEKYEALILKDDEVENWNKAAFSSGTPSVRTSQIKLFSCKSANGGDTSIATKIAQAAGATVFAYNGRSEYAEIISRKLSLSRIIEAIIGYKEPFAKKYWSDLANGIIRASRYQPKAAFFASAVQIDPSGRRTWISEIPDLGASAASNRLKNFGITNGSHMVW